MDGVEHERLPLADDVEIELADVAVERRVEPVVVDGQIERREGEDAGEEALVAALGRRHGVGHGDHAAAIGADPGRGHAAERQVRGVARVEAERRVGQPELHLGAGHSQVAPVAHGAAQGIRLAGVERLGVGGQVGDGADAHVGRQPEDLVGERPHAAIAVEGAYIKEGAIDEVGRRLAFVLVVVVEQGHNLVAHEVGVLLALPAQVVDEGVGGVCVFGHGFS